MGSSAKIFGREVTTGGAETDEVKVTCFMGMGSILIQFIFLEAGAAGADMVDPFLLNAVVEVVVVVVVVVVPLFVLDLLDFEASAALIGGGGGIIFDTPDAKTEAEYDLYKCCG